MQLTFSKQDIKDALQSFKTCSEMIIAGCAVGIFLQQSLTIIEICKRPNGQRSLKRVPRVSGDEPLFGIMLYILVLGYVIRRIE